MVYQEKKDKIMSLLDFNITYRDLCDELDWYQEELDDLIYSVENCDDDDDDYFEYRDEIQESQNLLLLTSDQIDRHIDFIIEKMLPLDISDITEETIKDI